MSDLKSFVILLYFMEQEHVDEAGVDCEISDDQLTIWKTKIQFTRLQHIANNDIINIKCNCEIENILFALSFTEYIIQE